MDPCAVSLLGCDAVFGVTPVNILNSKTNSKVFFVCVGVLRPSQQRGHVEPV